MPDCDHLEVDTNFFWMIFGVFLKRRSNIDITCTFLRVNIWRTFQLLGGPHQLYKNVDSQEEYPHPKLYFNIVLLLLFVILYLFWELVLGK